MSNIMTEIKMKDLFINQKKNVLKNKLFYERNKKRNIIQKR